MNSIMEAIEKKKLSTSQRPAVISLLDVYYKVIAKASATRLKETLP